MWTLARLRRAHRRRTPSRMRRLRPSWEAVCRWRLWTVSRENRWSGQPTVDSSGQPDAAARAAPRRTPGTGCWREWGLQDAACANLPDMLALLAAVRLSVHLPGA